MGGHNYSCCGCSQHGVDRRTFLAAVGGTALGGATLAGCATAGKERVAAGGPYVKPKLEKKAIVVQPVLTYSIPVRQKETSWRSWGAVQTQSDVDQEAARIDAELQELAGQAEFPVKVLPVAKVTDKGQAEELCKGTADVMLIYGAGADESVLVALISPARYNLLFLRHRSGPVSLWYEIASSRLLRKTVDEFGQPGLDPCDVVVDDRGDLLWRLRALYALKNTVGSRMVAIGSAGGWGAGGQKAPDIARFLNKRLSPEAEAHSDFHTRVEGTRIKHQLNRQAIKMYDKAGRVLRIECVSNDVSFYRHHRKVEHRDGTSDYRVADLKKSIFSLGDLAGLMRAGCARYLEFIGELEDRSHGQTNLEQISRPVKDERERSWRGFNFFLGNDLTVLLGIVRGEYQISGMSNRRMQAVLPGKSSEQIGRILKRLRLHGLIKKVGKTYKYYLTELGRRAVIVGLKLKEHLIVPALATATA